MRALKIMLCCALLALPASVSAQESMDADAAVRAGSQAWAAAWNLRFEESDSLAAWAEQFVARSRHMRSQMSVDNARFLTAIGRMDIEAAHAAHESLRNSPAMSQSYLPAVVEWNQESDPEASVRERVEDPV